MRAEFKTALRLADTGLAAAESAQMDDAVVAFTLMRVEAQIGGAQTIEPASVIFQGRAKTGRPRSWRTDAWSCPERSRRSRSDNAPG